MEEGDDGAEQSLYNTPMSDLRRKPSWSFQDEQAHTGASPSRPRPHLGTRHSSLPRNLFASNVSSIFGPGQAHMRDEQQQQEDASSRPPLLAVEPPSQESVPQTAVAGHSRRDMWYDELNRPAAMMVQSAQKDADDPTSESSTFHRHEMQTNTTLKDRKSVV